MTPARIFSRQTEKRHADAEADVVDAIGNGADGLPSRHEIIAGTELKVRIALQSGEPSFLDVALNFKAESAKLRVALLSKSDEFIEPRRQIIKGQLSIRRDRERLWLLQERGEIGLSS